MKYAAADLAIAMAASCLFVILVRSRELHIITKSRQQRTSKEQKEVEGGLLRSVLLDLLLFAPVSVTLMWMAMQPVLLRFSFVAALQAASRVSYDSFLGILSYGFPFVTVRRIVTRIAINSLKEFANTGLNE